MSSNKTPTHSEPFLPAKTLYQLQEEHAHSLFKEISLLENLVTIVQKKPSEKNIHLSNNPPLSSFYPLCSS